MPRSLLARAGAFHPPAWLPDAVAAVLRARLGLSMFNIDLICPTAAAGAPPDALTYQAIDINYFPGFDKMENFEGRWVAFLREQCLLSRRSPDARLRCNAEAHTND